MMCERWAAGPGVKMTWETADHNPHYSDWGSGPFHLARMARQEWGPEYAVALLRVALDAIAGDHGFMYQTTWPVVLDRGREVVRDRDVEASVVRGKGWLVADTLVIPSGGRR